MTVIDAVALLPEHVKLRILGYETAGHQGYVELLLRRAHELGIPERVEVVGTVARRSDLFSWCRRGHVGLAFMPDPTDDVNEQTMAGASNKGFDYLACGMPVLTCHRPEWREIYVDNGYGLACDPTNPEQLASSLRWLLDHPHEAHRMGEQGRQRILDDWHYEKVFAPVLDLLDGRLSTRMGGPIRS
jgi:glycosyltransferase involved in cell wall biosynthesis